MISRDIVSYFENVSGSKADSDEGILFGNSEKEVSKILICWMISKKAIEFAIKNECSHIVTHESLFYPYNIDIRKNESKKYSEWKINKTRLSLLMEYDLAVIRIHGMFDKLIIFDAFAAELGLFNCEKENELVKIYEIEPTDIYELINQVKNKLNLKYIRVSIPENYNKKIKSIGLPWGGLGLFVNVEYQQKLIDEGVDIMIGGESDSYGMRFAKEVNIPFIETGHESSENIGLKHYREILEKNLDIETIFYENKLCYKII